MKDGKECVLEYMGDGLAHLYDIISQDHLGRQKCARRIQFHLQITQESRIPGIQLVSTMVSLVQEQNFLFVVRS